MRGIGYRFTSREELRVLLESSRDREFDVGCGAALREGEWVVASFEVARDRLRLAARARDCGDGTRLGFEPRDWDRLAALSEECDRGRCRESSPPRSSEYRVSPAEANRVLIVDGERDVREMVCAVVRCSGFSCYAMDSAEEALDRLRREDFDLVVVEQELRGMSGPELCRRLRQLEYDKPLLLLANHAFAAEAAEFAGSGASDYVVRPFRAPELWARMISLLAVPVLEPCAQAS